MRKNRTISDLINPSQKNPSQLYTSPALSRGAQYATLLHGDNVEYERLRSLMSNLLSSDTTPKVVIAVAWLLFEHGLRISEALNISSEDVGRAGHLRVASLKGTRPRIILPSVLKSFWVNAPPYLLPLRNNYSRFYFYRWFKKCGLYARFGENKRNSVTHLFRHNLALQFKSDFEQSELTQSYLGHKSLKSTKHYEKERK